MNNTDHTTVPRISWNTLVDSFGNPDKNGAYIFGEALRLAGFAILTDSPFRNDLLQSNYKLMEEVFDLGVEQLTQKYAHPDIGFQRGYMPTHTEFGVRCDNEPDEKEVIAFGSYHNVAVSEIPGYIETAEEYYSACQEVGFTLMKVLSLYFDPEGSETEYITKLFRNDSGTKTDDSHMRHIRYPGTAKRMACAHTDSNMITLLPAATGSGLELLNNKNEWMAVNTFEGDLVINAGDMLNFISGGKIKSTLHRVENKMKNKSENRHSMPFFFHPDHTKELKILDSCKNNPKDNRMFPYEKTTGYALLFELLNLYKVIPEGVTLEQWEASMEKLKEFGY